MTASTHSGPAALCAHSMDLMATGSREDFERVFHPQAVNREAAVEPPAARQRGRPGSMPPPSGSAPRSPACALRYTRPPSTTTWWSST